ncbi:MAG: RNA polymerase subunit sigma-70 [Clostridia bacterium]|nr:RNA polymerase subunit sigma-70 [Clostridia bacterium]
MTIQDKTAINEMRLKGYKPSAIAAVLGIPPGTVRSYIHRHPDMPNTKLCKHCGKPVPQNIGHKEKKFCSDKCRMAWWNSHQDSVNRKAYYNLTCKHCGKEFESYGNKNRKYCSRECYLAARQLLAR